MNRFWNYLLGRFYEARSVRALNLHYHFDKVAEKFFLRAGINRKKGE